MFKQIKNIVLVKVQEEGNVYSILKNSIGYKNQVLNQLSERIRGDESNAIRMYNIPNWNYKVVGKLSNLTDNEISYFQDDENNDHTIETFKNLIETVGWAYRPEETMILGKVEICRSCNTNIATWFYMPAGDDDRYYCDDCVPRGCSCNRYYAADDLNPLSEETVKYFDENEVETTKDAAWAYFVPVDENGEQFPCCEYTYEENGFLI